MLADRFSPSNTNIVFNLSRLASLALGLVVVSLALVALLGFNLGIDFSGGVIAEVQLTDTATIGDVKQIIASIGASAVVQEFGSADIVLVKIGLGTNGDASAIRLAVEQALEGGAVVQDWRRVETVGPAVSSELAETASIAVALALFVIMIYVWLRFEWQFAIGALLALGHDIILTLGFFALTGLELNLPSVAAVLTISGYSINDTVVIYDRIREYIKRHPKLTIREIVNLALNASLTRTLVTSVTTLIALVALVGFGGAIIREFALAMMFGVIVGTFSSLAVAGWLVTKIEPVRDEDESPRP
ncbi:MAG: protein translocase subunit SecF [Alphaproteobacteria bacterium]|nr:protein translocase subunit SecF [Alphaproteobacteria bacterium]